MPNANRPLLIADELEPETTEAAVALQVVRPPAATAPPQPVADQRPVSSAAGDFGPAIVVGTTLVLLVIAIFHFLPS
jgi:hypothetical protein